MAYCTLPKQEWKSIIETEIKTERPVLGNMPVVTPIYLIMG